MPNQIEVYDQKRRRMRKGQVIWFAIFFTAWIARSGLKIFKASIAWLDGVLLVVLVISLLIQAYYALSALRLERKASKDPFIQRALNDELNQLNELKAWRAGFFAIIGFTVLAALAWLWIGFQDFMLILLTALMVGFGTYNTTVYILDR